MSDEIREYIDEATGIRLTVEEEYPVGPRVTVFPSEERTLSRGEINDALQRLLIMADIKPPESTPKHDGKLDETEDWFHASVESAENVRDDLRDPKIGGIHLHGGYGDCESNCIYLDAQQTLSLLAWLEQKRSTLEQLAKEQE